VKSFDINNTDKNANPSVFEAPGGAKKLMQLPQNAGSEIVMIAMPGPGLLIAQPCIQVNSSLKALFFVTICAIMSTR